MNLHKLFRNRKDIDIWAQPTIIKVEPILKKCDNEICENEMIAANGKYCESCFEKLFRNPRCFSCKQIIKQGLTFCDNFGKCEKRYKEKKKKEKKDLEKQKQISISNN